VFAKSNVEAERLGDSAFSSRKEPELMRHRLVACPVCDTVYASPAPEARALVEEYERASFDSGEEARSASRTYARLVQALAPRLLRGGALDIGTGDGAFLEQLLAIGFDDVVGVEPSTAPIVAAAEPVRGLIRQGAFRASDFEPGRFSLITAFQTLEHVNDPLELCRGAVSLLAPGGALLLVCHDRRALVNRLMGTRSPINDIEHLQLFSPRSLTQVLGRAGLRVAGLARVRNDYPLRYWLRLAPVPARARWIAAADRLGLGAVQVSLRVGNLAAVGFVQAGGGPCGGPRTVRR